MSVMAVPGKLGRFLTLDNGTGFKVVLSTFGAGIYQIYVDDAPMLIGPKDLFEYEISDAYYGKTIGRYAGRVPNGELAFHGKTIQLPLNDPFHHTLHGGLDGFSFHDFSYERDEYEVRMSYFSPRDEAGFPGAVTLKVFYSVTPNEYALHINYFIDSDEETPVGLTCHSYFNLGGEETVLGDSLLIPADAYYTTKMKAPEKLSPVPPLLDFRRPRIIKDICLDPTLPGDTGGGIDFIFLTNGKTTVLENEAYRLEVQTDFPTIACYTNNYPREGQKLSNGLREQKYSAIALECEEIPNDFDAICVHPGETRRRHIDYLFTKKK
ncbi:MAG: hypothetical protein J6328_02860 [Bacilli bacterium]|nr:hypothetical protein [Bacilli bacterium]